MENKVIIIKVIGAYQSPYGAKALQDSSISDHKSDLLRCISPLTGRKPCKDKASPINELQKECISPLTGRKPCKYQTGKDYEKILEEGISPLTGRKPCKFEITSAEIKELGMAYQSPYGAKALQVMYKNVKKQVIGGKSISPLTGRKPCKV